MKEIRVNTAYGNNLIPDSIYKKSMLSRISDAMSIRNKNFNEFCKELDLLLTKYQL